MEVHSRLIISKLSLRKISAIILHAKTKCPVNTAEWTTVGRVLSIYSIVVALSFWLSNQWVNTLFLKIFSEFYFSESILRDSVLRILVFENVLQVSFLWTLAKFAKITPVTMYSKIKNTHKVVEIIPLT